MSLASVNQVGNVAFLGQFSSGSSVVEGTLGAGATYALSNVSFAPSSGRIFSFPQIDLNAATGKSDVIAQDLIVAGGVDTFIRTWHPDGTNTIDDAGIPGTNTVVLPTISPDGSQFADVSVTSGTDVLRINGTPDHTFPAGTGGARPMIANTGAVVYRDGSLTTSPIRVSQIGHTVVTIASSSDFSDLGNSPGISPDGKIVTFYGNLTAAGALDINLAQPLFTPLTAGAGIFASIQTSTHGRVIVRVAGVGGPGVPGVSPDVATFDADNRVAVTSVTANPSNPAENYITVAFMGQDSAGHDGFYVNLVNFFGPTGDPTGFRPNIDTLVAQAGDSITGFGTIQSLSVYDPIADNGQVAFTVNGAGSTSAIVTAHPVPVLAVTRLSQGGSWASASYAGGGTNPDTDEPYTIGNSGCNLTSLAMTVNYAGAPTLSYGGASAYTPVTLNAVLLANGGYTGHLVNLEPAARIAATNGGVPTLKWNVAKVSDADSLTALLTANHTPIIVGVEGGGHFVVVTGKVGDHFIIADPGFAARHTLDVYGNHFTTRGYYTDPTDFSGLSFAGVGATPGVEVLVTDSSGRRSGTDPITGTVYNEIPQSVMYTDALEDFPDAGTASETGSFVDVSAPQSGVYTISVGGTVAEPYTISASPISPDGFLLQPGTFSGSVTPGLATTYTFDYDPTQVALNPFAIPGGTVGTAYSQAITAGAGSSPETVTYSVTHGSIPAGLTFTVSGNQLLIAGTPTATGSVSFDVTATDSVKSTHTQSYTLVINPSITLSPGSLPDGNVGTPYSQTITASNGTGVKVLSYVITAGAIPDGLTFTPDANQLGISGTPTASGTVSFDVTATDEAGATDTQSYTLTTNTTAAPTVSSVSTTTAAGTYGTGSVITLDVNFSANVFVTGAPTLTLNDGATASYTSGSGSSTLVFTYTVSAGDTTNGANLDYSSTTALALSGGTIKDSSGNNADLTLPGPGSATDTLGTTGIIIDATTPTVASVSSTTANGTYGPGASIAITIAFSEAVTVTGTPTLALNSGGTASYTSGSGTSTLTFTYAVGAGDTTSGGRLDYSSTGALALSGGTIQNAGGNNANLTLPADGSGHSLSDNKAIVIDATTPTVSSISTTTAAGTYGTGAVISIDVDFSENVFVTGTPILTLSDGQIASYSSGSGTKTLVFTYTVAAGDTTGGANLDYTSTTALSGGTIQNAGGVSANETLPAPGSTADTFGTKGILIDATTATVSNVSSTTANGTYETGASIAITITFSEAVTVTGTPTLALNDGATASYSSGSGTNTLTFTYTVGAGDTTSGGKLDYSSTGALALGGGTIKNASGQNANLTLPADGSGHSLSDNKAIVIDATTATVSNVSSTTANGTYGVGAVINITIAFSEAVTVTGTPQLALNSGGTASYSSGSGTNTLTFTYTVAAGQNANPLDEASSSALTLSGGTITNAGGVNANLTLPAPGTTGSLGTNKDILIDTTAPTVVAYYVLFGSEKYNLIGSTRNDLPWLITGIQVVFSKAIASGDVDSLSGLTTTGFSGLGTNTLTWTITPVTIGKFATVLQGSGTDDLKDAAGNGLGGGAGFAQNFNVLEGDFNDDGVVTSADMVDVYNATKGSYNIFADINGDGTVTMADVSLVRQLIGNHL